MAERHDNDIEISTKSTTSPLEGAVGASDANNGGGAGAGIPDADLVDRAGEAVTRGDVRQDREKMFPEAEENRPPGANAGD